jgi:hypothetical protein
MKITPQHKKTLYPFFQPLEKVASSDMASHSAVAHSISFSSKRKVLKTSHPSFGIDNITPAANFFRLAVQPTLREALPGTLRASFFTSEVYEE